MTLIGFLLRYFRHYTAWALLALVAALFYGGLTAGIVALIEPVFAEVLLAGDQGSSMLGMLGESSSSEDGSDATSGGDPGGRLKGFFARFQLKDQLDRAYERLKVRFHINSDNVVYFLPLLVVVVFLLRSLSNLADCRVQGNEAVRIRAARDHPRAGA
jgi:hypothetical protein